MSHDGNNKISLLFVFILSFCLISCFHHFKFALVSIPATPTLPSGRERLVCVFMSTCCQVLWAAWGHRGPCVPVIFDASYFTHPPSGEVTLSDCWIKKLWQVEAHNLECFDSKYALFKKAPPARVYWDILIDWSGSPELIKITVYGYLVFLFFC